MKGVLLLSGGLDSLLAGALVLRQGVHLEALCCITPFCGAWRNAKRAAKQLGIPLHFRSLGRCYIELVKNPPHGYGSGANPCIDCHIMMLRCGSELMRRVGASFLVTGEVLGERPMSQRYSTLRLIEKEAGLERLILRPLSAKLLWRTIPEERGWVERRELCAIRGRGRKKQMELAQRFGLRDYPQPAGGCLLTEPSFAARIRDLNAIMPCWTIRHVHWLKNGRYLRLGHAVRLVIGRNHNENIRLRRLCDDSAFLIEHDQSYFLCMLPSQWIGRLLFPVGKMSKEEVRSQAVRLGVSFANRPPTRGACFLGDDAPSRIVRRFFPEALRPGPLITDKGEVLGTHTGIANYTIGQRVTLFGDRLYVLRIDPQENTVVLSPRQDCMAYGMVVGSVNWHRSSPKYRVSVQIRHPGKTVPCRLNGMTVLFDEAVFGVAPGQYAAFYEGDRLLGGAKIVKGLYVSEERYHGKRARVACKSDGEIKAT